MPVYPVGVFSAAVVVPAPSPVVAMPDAWVSQ